MTGSVNHEFNNLHRVNAGVQLREAMASEMKGRTLGGPDRVVEVDGGYFGGYVKPANRKENRVDRRLARHQNGKRQVVVVMREREGLRWRAVPSEYGPRTTLFNRFNRWSKRGLWQDLLAALTACAEPPEIVMVDSTAVRAHRSAAGGEHGQAIGRSRGGRTTKIHALCDGEGRLYALMLTGGHVHDIFGGRALLARVPAMRQFIADKAYDADDVRNFLVAQGTDAVISPMPRRRTPPPFKPVAYRMRNLIERAFCKLKDWRAVATRYDKTARNFLAGVCLAVAITDWLS